MKNHTATALGKLLLIIFVLTGQLSFSQEVEFPPEPPYDIVAPWGYTDEGTNWDTSPFLPFTYSFNRFRLMPPNGVTYESSTDTWSFDPEEKYPIILFFHGAGEGGDSNNKQLKHGGQRHRNAVQSGEFPGFLLYPQNSTIQSMKLLLDKLAEDLPIDLNRVYVHGLSLGGVQTWNFTLLYPETVAGAFPMSAIVGDDKTDLIYTGLRISQGGLDKNPNYQWTEDELATFEALGGQIEYFFLPTAGHGTWNQMYNRSDFFSWFLDQKVNNIIAKFGYDEVCPEDPIDVTLGVNPGHNGYEWMRNGVVLSGENGHELNVSSFGKYQVRVQIGTTWTDWSEEHIVKEKTPTATPPITVDGLQSTVLPDPNGKTTVTLGLPDGYTDYLWHKDGVEFGTTQTIEATAGTYEAYVTEEFGCSSLPSRPFYVIDNSSPGAVPPKVQGLEAFNVQKSQLTLNWIDPVVAIKESGYEIWRKAEGEELFSLITVTKANKSSYTDTDLLPGTEYTYIMRSYNSQGASEVSDAIVVLTDSDQNPPSAPSQLIITSLNNFSTGLEWLEATDDVGVERYEIYQNEQKVLVTSNTNITVYNLEEGEIYRFAVRAVDLAGNVSPFSNIVISQPVAAGLNYEYYEGSWSALPDFDVLTPIKTGLSDNVDIGVREQNDYFAFRWSGVINIPEAGSYTFETYSDDGSKLYIGSYDEADLVVDNDGLHGNVYAEGTYVFDEAGSYPIVITFFERTGGHNIQVYWKNTPMFTNRQLIPDAAFRDEVVIPEEDIYSPYNLAAVGVSYDQVDLTWQDSSAVELGFQVYRSIDGINFSPIAIVEPDTYLYEDTNVDPATTYYYRVITLGLYGQSSGAQAPDAIAHLNFENDISDISGNGVNSNISGTVTFPTGNSKEGVRAAEFPGGNNYIDLDIGNQFIHTAFTERSVAFWVYNSQPIGILDLYDEGGSTNGFGIRINDGNVDFAVQDNHSIVTISGALPLNEWAHVAAVFDNGETYLYINGDLASSELNVGYPDVGSHSNGGGLGATNSSNAFDAANNNFTGLIDDFYAFDVALSEEEIETIIATVEGYATATTLPLPGLPNAPANFSGSAISTSEVSLDWDDDSVSGYEVWKSVDGTNFYLLETVTNSDHTDEELSAHTDYFYTVRAFNVTGNSGYTDTVTVQTLNSIPEITSAIQNLAVLITGDANFVVTATDADGDDISFETENFPAFITLMDNNDDTADVTIDPSPSDIGTYENLGIRVNDGFGGVSDYTYFTVIITDNEPPVITEVSPVEMFGGETLDVEIIASDANDDDLTWFVDNLPGFGTSSTNGDTLTLTFTPSYSDDGGTYFIDLRVEDTNTPTPGFDEFQLELTVTPFDPNHKIYLNFGDGAAAGAPWNDLFTSSPSSGTVFTDIINDDGYPLDMTLTLGTTWSGVGTNGGMPTGIYPDEVRMSYFWTDLSPEVITVSGLDPNLLYNFEFFGSRNKDGNRSSIYDVDGNVDTLQARYNTDQTIEFNGIVPNASGEITITVSNIPSPPVEQFSIAYLNALIIESVSSTGLPPYAPTNLSAAYDNGQIDLNWDDNSDDETGFEIYKSVGDDTNFNLLTTTTNDNYQDGDISQEDYYYRVRAINQFGESEYTNTAVYVYTNLAPSIAVDESIMVQIAGTGSVDYVITDPEDDSVTVTINSLPSFGQFSYSDNYNGTLTFDPSLYDAGTYYVEIEVEDKEGNISTKTVIVEVTDKVFETILVNFTPTSGIVAGAPWNNVIGAPNAGLSLTNLTNTEGVGTGYDIELLDTWAGGNANGVTTGDDSGVYPDNVMETYFADYLTNDLEIMISGLDPAKIYDLEFFCSRTATGDTRSSIYKVGGQQVTLQATNNSSETVFVNALKSNASGELTFAVNLGSGSTWKYINALEIRYYDEPLFPNAPTNLVANATSKSDIELSWSDNSSNEDGFELYRSTSESGPWDLHATLGANVTGFTDAGLGINEQYFYRVNAYNINSPSLHSNVASATTYSYTIFINVAGEDMIAPSPWNNTNSYPFLGTVTYDLKNDIGNNTGISMEIVDNPGGTSFAGDGTKGMATGDDSGVYPDIVMQSYYWIEQYEYASLEFANVPINQKFNVTFFASREATSRGTTFHIGEQSVSVNAAYNTTETGTIYDVVADENGHFQVDLISMEGVLLAYINAIVINASYNNGGARAEESTIAENISEEENLHIYPNPFSESLNIRVNSSKAETLKMSIIDQSGRLMTEEFIEVDGSEIIKINTESFQEGLYIMRVQNEQGETSVFKLIK